MGNHSIPLPPELNTKLSGQTNNVFRRVAMGEILSYPSFVDKLFKECDTVALTLHHATTGIAGEGGELLDASKKCWIYNKPLDVANVIEELGDLRFYYQKALNMLGITDEDVQAANMYKLSLGENARFPDGVYSDQAAQDRRDKQAEGETARSFIGHKGD